MNSYLFPCLGLGNGLFATPQYDATPLSSRQTRFSERKHTFSISVLAIEVEFWKGGSLQYMATTWAGYVGVLTAVKPQSFSLSINFRCCNTGNVFTNIMSAIKGGWPVAVFIRNVFETAPSFAYALDISFYCMLIKY